MIDSEISAEAMTVVIAVKEPALAISIEITVQALGLTAVVHGDPTRLGELPLTEKATLIIDQQLIPRGAKGFFNRLRAQRWRGLAIVLSEDDASAPRLTDAAEYAVALEKPFLNSDLVKRLRIAYPENENGVERATNSVGSLAT